MFKLVFRDLFIYQRRNLIILPIFAVYFLFVFRPWEGGSLDAILIAISLFAVTMTTQTAFAYDEASKFNKYLRAMPISPQTIVLSRYATGFCTAAMGVICSILFSVIFSLFAPAFGMPGIRLMVSPEAPLVCFIAVALCTSLINPIVFRFGYQKSRYLLLLFFWGIIGTGGYIVASRISSIEGLIPADVSITSWLLLLAAVLALCLYGSYRLSVRMLTRLEM
jgi:hypothetical protein